MITHTHEPRELDTKRRRSCVACGATIPEDRRDGFCSGACIHACVDCGDVVRTARRDGFCNNCCLHARRTAIVMQWQTEALRHKAYTTQ
jgi:hypothetical protein